jgi:hypothetical protein
LTPPLTIFGVNNAHNPLLAQHCNSPPQCDHLSWQCEFNSAHQTRLTGAWWSWSCPMQPKMLGAWYNGKWLALAPAAWICIATKTVCSNHLNPRTLSSSNSTNNLPNTSDSNFSKIIKSKFKSN